MQSWRASAHFLGHIARQIGTLATPQIGKMPSPKTRTNLDTANHHVAEKSLQKSLHNFCGRQLWKRLSPVVTFLAVATISSREMDSDRFLAVGAQSTWSAAKRAIRLRRAPSHKVGGERFHAQLPAQGDSEHTAVIARLSE
jgi:hypothetical protein